MADHGIAAIEQDLAEMRPDEPGGAGDDDACHVCSLVSGRRGPPRRDQTAGLRWKRPRTRVSHMILMSSVTDQFSM